MEAEVEVQKAKEAMEAARGQVGGVLCSEGAHVSTFKLQRVF